MKNEPAPDVVLLGSSLMMIPVSVLDADYLHKDLDAVYHDHSVYLENALSAAQPGKHSCFNFAIPGGMVSDDYMIMRALLNGEHRPKVIVLGLTLRDFIESHVPCPAATTSFKYFKHFFNIDDIAELAMPEFWQRLDYWQSKLVYMVGQRLDLQVAFNQGVKTACDNLLGAAAETRSAVPVELTSNVAHNLKSEAEPGDFVLHAGQIYPYEDNSGEYKKRFSNPSKKLFNTESLFLSRLLADARKNGVQVLLVNMPLTPANMGLMPAGYYSQYLTTVKEQARAFGSPLIDLNNGTAFSISDFRDTAHMNASGGKKLLDAIVATVKADDKIASALAVAAAPAPAAHPPAGADDLNAAVGKIAGRVTSAPDKSSAPGAL